MNKFCFVSMLMLASASAASAYDFEADGICYSVLSADSKTVEVAIPATPYAGEIIVPATVVNDGQEYAVKSIGKKSFSEAPELTKLTLGANVNEVKDSACYNCPKLVGVVFGSGLETIGTGAFSDCVLLEEAALLASLKNLGAYAFSDAHSLRSAALPEGLLNLGEGAFHQCWNVPEAIIPSTRANCRSETLIPSMPGKYCRVRAVFYALRRSMNLLYSF